ncbi:MAG: alkaline phosphatase family protein [Halobacteriales archaeon]
MTLRDAVERDIRDRRAEEGYLFPDYGGYCFAGVPGTAADVLGADLGPTLPGDVLQGIGTDVGRVLVVLVDGFGLGPWRRDRDEHPLLDRLTERGRVTPLTSVYPSETAAAITTFHTARLPARHGLIGWNLYEPTIDTTFESLPFRTKDGDEPPMDRAALYEGDPLYPALAEAGIESHHVVPFQGTYEGARCHSYDDLAGIGEGITDVLGAATPPAYVFAYLPQIDSVSHHEGTEAPAYGETLDAIEAQLESVIESVPPAVAEDTLLVVTADHGHVDTGENVDLGNLGIEGSLRRHADGTPIRFAGSPRNLHLHVQPDALGDVRDRLSELDARVFERETAFERGLFGGDPCGTLRRRVGDLVVVHRDRGVWWADLEPAEFSQVGMHGGLHPEEMLVPLAAAELSRLR